jgi:hypothetical protein
MRLREVERSNRIRTGLALVLMAALGGTAGHLATSRAASACDCSPFEWQVRLQAATSSDPASNHQSFWPAQAILNAYQGHAYIWATAFSAGVIGSARAGR